MALTCSMQIAMKFPTYGYQHHVEGLRGSISSNSARILSFNDQSHLKDQNLRLRGQLCLLGDKLSSVSLSFQKQYSRSTGIPNRFVTRPSYLQCQCSQNSGLSLDATFVKNGTLNLAWFYRSCSNWQISPVIVQLALAVGVLIFILRGLGPFVRLSKSICQNKHANSWKEGSAYHVAISYIQCFFVWFGAMLIFRALDLVVPPTEAGKIVKHFLHFASSLSTALTFHGSASSLYLRTQKYMEIDGARDVRRMFGQWGVNVVYYCMRAVGTRAFMELSGCRPCFMNDLSNLAFHTAVLDGVCIRFDFLLDVCDLETMQSLWHTEATQVYF
ncbi:mechanosensitive ion channel protein 2, chloroplastic-like isoform X2 [Henckelia pumila]|uniref:mechanosensitive ion channel protein 2, chloroplastic-like isoform X2 n=1 Tax=Henckelia pumila TaxID=405737 RepID=UPI003C6E0153